MANHARLRQKRQELPNKVGEGFDRIALKPRGKSCSDRDKAKGRKINRDVLNAVLEFADALERFRSKTSQPPQRH